MIQVISLGFLHHTRESQYFLTSPIYSLSNLTNTEHASREPNIYRNPNNCVYWYPPVQKPDICTGILTNKIAASLCSVESSWPKFRCCWVFFLIPLNYYKEKFHDAVKRQLCSILKGMFLYSCGFKLFTLAHSKIEPSDSCYSWTEDVPL